MHYMGMSAAVFAEGSVCDAAKGISAATLVIVISVFSLCGLLMTLILSRLDAKFDMLLLRSNQSLEDANRRLQVLATVDTLTGLPNRSYFMERIEQRILYAHHHDIPFSIMFMDLDGFKTINDSLGHGGGDELLKAFAQALQSRVRSQDLVARLGGDEFVVLLDGLGQPKEVAPIAAAVLERMQKDFLIRNVPLRVTASVGIATYPQHGDTVCALLKNADMAMYDAKQHGRNTYRFFNASMSDAVSRVMKIYKGLGEGLEKNQFSMVFQPKFDGLRNKMVGAEALIRWHHPEMGNIPPMDFIPLAEQTGQITQISDWVIAEVCRQMRGWERMGLAKVKVAINLSPEQLRQEKYAERVTRMVADAGIEPEWIMFEITETVAMCEPEMARDVIRQFQQAGFDIAIDDFGTGYSSMAYLQQFRVKELKIDRFFTGALDDAEGQTIVSAIIALAHSLHMTVVAEGVETMAQLKQLKGMNCDEVQGYFLAKPLRASDFERFMRDHSDNPYEARGEVRVSSLLPALASA
jgi:diguanylate cyclase (GGDEF)-like protein